MTATTPAVDRVLAKIRRDGECWVFTGSLTWNGYGRINGGPSVSTRLAHRVTYEGLVGPIPAGLDLDHLCRVRACVNPAHLEPVTRSENLRRAMHLGDRNRTKTHCPEGHAYDEDNTQRKATGGRGCLLCMTREFRALRAARAAGADIPRGVATRDEAQRLARQSVAA